METRRLNQGTGIVSAEIEQKQREFLLLMDAWMHGCMIDSLYRQYRLGSSLNRGSFVSARDSHVVLQIDPGSCIGTWPVHPIHSY